MNTFYESTYESNGKKVHTIFKDGAGTTTVTQEGEEPEIREHETMDAAYNAHQELTMTDGALSIDDYMDTVFTHLNQQFNYMNRMFSDFNLMFSQVSLPSHPSPPGYWCQAVSVLKETTLRPRLTLLVQARYDFQ